jgi:long-chain-fatty-acid---luciferin-component ligase
MFQIESPSVGSALLEIGAECAAPTLDPIDAWLGHDDLYALPPNAVADIRIEFLRAAVTHHRKHNPHYDRYCTVQGFDHQNQLQAVADLERIPLLPCAVFKRNQDRIRTGGVATEAVDTRSSGTQGTLSIVPRDNGTLMRFFASVAIGHRELFGVEGFDRPVFSIGPPTSAAPNLWIAYVMTGLAVALPTTFYMDNNDLFDIEQLVHDLRQLPGDAGAILVGPPPLLLDLAAFLEATDPLNLGLDALVATIGGWKRRQSEVVARDEFSMRVARALGIPDVSRIRDTFNMVELNSVFFECRFHRKHCPPWVVANVRDPETLDALPSGASGILAFLDPTPTSYPGFILSDDFGAVEGCVTCECGIVGDIVSIHRRVNRVESRGCALKLEGAQGGRHQ